MKSIIFIIFAQLLFYIPSISTSDKDARQLFVTEFSAECEVGETAVQFDLIAFIHTISSYAEKSVFLALDNVLYLSVYLFQLYMPPHSGLSPPVL